MGQIEAIRERSFYGAKAATYVTLYFKRENLRLMLLEDDVPKTVRGLISPEESEQLLEQLKQWSGSVNKQWKARADKHQAALDSGNPYRYGQVLKSLSQMESEGETLRHGDRQHLLQSQELLVEEIGRSLGKTPQQANQLLAAAVSC